MSTEGGALPGSEHVGQTIEIESDSNTSSVESRPDVQIPLDADESGTLRGNPVSTSGRRKSRGGFQVEFRELGEQEFRARYVREERVIYVNLDHPQIKAARGGESIDDIMFRRVAYEVAFCEYAIALASELAASQEYMDPTDPIIDIRETMNRMAVTSARLYEAR